MIPAKETPAAVYEAAPSVDAICTDPPDNFDPSVSLRLSPTMLSELAARELGYEHRKGATDGDLFDLGSRIEIDLRFSNGSVPYHINDALTTYYKRKNLYRKIA